MTYLMKPTAILFALLGVFCGQSFAADKPNILIIVSDDQGYVDAGFQGGKEVPTTHLDKLAGDVMSLPHERLFWRLRGKEFAVREGAWKLMELEGKPAQLFDLASDLGEKKDLAAEHPDIAQRLAAALAEWRKGLQAPVFPGSSVKDEDWDSGGINQKQGQPKKTNP